MGQDIFNILKWFTYALITLLICMIITAPLAIIAEVLFDSWGVHSTVKNVIFWIIGFFGLFAGMGIAVRLGFDVFSIPVGKVDRDAG